jgi:hypothetical protein
MTARRDSQVQSTERVPGERARAHWIGGYNINGRNKNGLLSRHSWNPSRLEFLRSHHERGSPRSMKMRCSVVFGRWWTEVGLNSRQRDPYSAMTFRGRPPRRPFARELSALRALLRLPTKAAAVTKFTFGRA